MSNILKIGVVVLVALAAAACRDEGQFSYGLNDDNGTPTHQSGDEVDPFESAHSPG